jgi:hypothetical protein
VTTSASRLVVSQLSLLHLLHDDGRGLAILQSQWVGELVGAPGAERNSAASSDQIAAKAGRKLHVHH